MKEKQMIEGTGLKGSSFPNYIKSTLSIIYWLPVVCWAGHAKIKQTHSNLSLRHFLFSGGFRHTHQWCPQESVKAQLFILSVQSNCLSESPSLRFTENPGVIFPKELNEQAPNVDRLVIKTLMFLFTQQKPGLICLFCIWSRSLKVENVSNSWRYH